MVGLVTWGVLVYAAHVFLQRWHVHATAHGNWGSTGVMGPHGSVCVQVKNDDKSWRIAAAFRGMCMTLAT